MVTGIYSSINEEKFKTPDMGEYYDEDLVEEFLSKINTDKPMDAAYYVEEPFTTKLGYFPEYEAFVIKAEPVIQAKNKTEGYKAEELNVIDGDTAVFDLNTVEDGGEPFEINGGRYKGFVDYCFDKIDWKDFRSGQFKIRSVGIDAAEIPHYALAPVKKEDLNKMIISLTFDKVQSSSKTLIYEKLAKRENGKEIKFLRNPEKKNTYHEIVKDYGTVHPFKETAEGKALDKALDDMNKNDKKPDEKPSEKPKEKVVHYYKIVKKDDQEAEDMKDGKNMGLAARDEMIKMLAEAEDIRIVIDAKQLIYKTGNVGVYEILENGLSEDASIWDLTRAYLARSFGEGLYKYTGFNTFGQDVYRRFLGAIYIKKRIPNNDESVWINLNKYLIASIGDKYIKLKPGPTPADQHAGNRVSDAFNVWSYDNSRTVIADGFFEMGKKDFDDRRAIQKEITGFDFSAYRDYTVMIGDCLFMVPPTSIRVVNQVDSDRINLLRSKGSMLKTKPHSDRIIEMTLYFNNDEGINGIPIKKKLPRQVGTDESVTYYMNGLRSLISMFKYTPFLPIENQYINDDLGIEAVSLANLQIQTMPMYPKCIAATLTLQQFNYRVYLNELPGPSPEEGESFNKNVFASAINYEVMRYYYQKAMQNGEKIKNLTPLSQEYIESTMGSKTNLIPMEFKDQNIEFFILDKEWLDKMLAIKRLAEKRPLQQTQEINKKTREWARMIGVSMSAILETLKKNSSYEDEMVKVEGEKSLFDYLDPDEYMVKKLNDELVTSQKCPYLLNVTSSKEGNANNDIYKFSFDTGLLTQAELKNLMLAIAKETGIEKAKDMFLDGSIGLKYTKIGDNYVLQCPPKYESPEWEIAEFFAFRSTGYGAETEVDNGKWGNFAQSSNEQFFQDMKDNAIDIEGLYSAKFKAYPIENIVAQQFSISMGNIMANTKLKLQEGYAPQYVGGQDTIIDFVFHTKEREVVGALNAMQSMAAEYLVTYRKIINCWPIRINSEMTKLCGINEVAIESIDISTVPMQPGLFAVHVRAISLDRTMRNREALRRIDSINNAGSINPANASSYVYRTYFDLNNVLSQAEIYPDLELPTIKELEEAGFKYIRYMKKKEKRMYPDPDFYFVYAHVYASQMIRKTIIEYFEKVAQEDGKKPSAPIVDFAHSMVDGSSGQVFTVELEKDPETVKENLLRYTPLDLRLMKNIEAGIKEEKEKIENISERHQKEREALKEKLNSAKEIYEKGLKAEQELMSFNSLTWDVCTKIKCSFAENFKTTTDEKNAMEALNKTGQEIIKIINEKLDEPIKLKKDWKPSYPQVEWNYHAELVSEIKKFINDDSTDSTIYTWKTILKKFRIENDKELKETIGGIFEAAAMAMSGNAEYDKEITEDDYRARAFLYVGVNTDPNNENDYRLEGDISYAPDHIYIPYTLIMDEDTGELFYAANKNDAIKKGMTFGPYQIRKYHSDILRDMYLGKGYDFTEPDFLDPYYNKTINKDVNQEEYKLNLITYPRYSIEAFSRIALFWMKDMIEKGVFLSLFDVKRGEITDAIKRMAKANKTDEEFEKEKNVAYFNRYLTGESDQKKETSSYAIEDGLIRSEQKKVDEEISPILEYGRKVSEVLAKYDTQLLAGKVFMAVCAAVVQGDKYIYKRMLEKDIGTLSAKTRSCQMGIDASSELEDSERYFRKLIRGLAATSFNVMKGISFISSSSQTDIERVTVFNNQKLWLEASNDPSLWVLHSFYDMIVNNKRGRMARAFPTYYMLLIDEGREIGYWKLHDNFYNTSSIAEIEVVKSRKMPADTARIVMTNMFKTFTTEDEDIKTDYEHNIRDVFNSIFSPRIHFQQEEARRQAQMEVNKFTLKPGARVHLRMGYSGDASELPILFNGVVAEVNPGEVMEIIAQGDGHEITNPGVFAVTTASDLADLTNEASGLKWITNFFTKGDTPKSLIRNVMTTKSKFLGTIMNKYTNGRFFNDNMFGITHFGEIDYIDIHKDGEIMQNIYEGEGGMPWHKEQTEMHASTEHYMPEPPRFTVELKDKSVWDLLNVCASSSLEFITGVTTFGLRSTIFHGRPHYYYAYDYELSDEGQIKEKRKPYQQYHIIDSFSDIIGNNITASGRDIKTVAVPIYKGPNGLNITEEKKLPSPLYVDWDIYPEYQKTMVVNTQMTYKASKGGAIGYNYYKDKFSEKGGRKIAWRMGANALKESIKDMYQGEVIIIGDPSIKPLDRVFLHDIYENMNGAFGVEAVVHRMTPEGGFTSSVFADCISTVDNRYEEVAGMWTARIAAQVGAAKLAFYIKDKLFGTNTKPMLNTITKIINKGAYASTKTINAAAGLMDKKELIKYANLENWSEALRNSVGASGMDIKAWSTIDKFNAWEKKLSSLSINKTGDMIDSLKVLREVVEFMGEDAIGPDKMVNMLEEALNGGYVKDKNINDIKEVRDKLKELNKINASKIDPCKGVKSVADNVIKQLNNLDLDDNGKKILKSLKDLNKGNVDNKTAIKILDTIEDIKKIDKYKDKIEIAETAGKYIDDVVNVAKDAKKIANTRKIGSAITTVVVSTGIITTIAAAAAEMALEYIIVKNIKTWIESTMASFNVLTIHPLKKDGSAYVAGIDGHKGSVVGSPTWEKKGPIDNFMDWVFKGESWFHGILRVTLISEEMNSIYEKYYKDKKLGDQNYENERMIDELLESIATSQANIQSSFRGLTLSKRIGDLKESNAKYMYNVSRIKDKDDPNIARNLIPINKVNDRLESFFDNNSTVSLLLNHDEYKNSHNVKHKAYDDINFHYYELPNKTNVDDIPFIRPDAFEVFYRLLEIVKEESIDKYGEDNKVKVIFTSGTTVGDNTWSSTGYVFRVRVLGLDKIEEIFNQMTEELNELFVNKNDAYQIFQYQKVEGSEDEYEVFVSPKDFYVKVF